MKKRHISKTTKIRILIFILIVLWACLVFSLSNQTGTDSSGLSRKITSFFCKSEDMIDLVEPYIRKLAHFSEYGVGGILFLAMFLTYKWSELKQIIVSVLLGAWYAGFDELHQFFVSDRHSGIEDVWIDTLGVATGAIFLMIIYKLIIKNKKNKEEIVVKNKEEDIKQKSKNKAKSVSKKEEMEKSK